MYILYIRQGSIHGIDTVRAATFIRAAAAYVHAATVVAASAA